MAFWLAAVLLCGTALAPVSTAQSSTFAHDRQLAGDVDGVLNAAQELMSEGKFDQAAVRLLTVASLLETQTKWAPNKDIGQIDFRSLQEQLCKIYTVLVECYESDGLPAKAEGAQERLLSLREDMSGGDDLAEEFNNAGRLYFKHGSYKRAQQCMERLFQSNRMFFSPRYSTLHDNYRKVLEKLGRPDLSSQFEAQVAANRNRPAQEPLEFREPAATPSSPPSAGPVTKRTLDDENAEAVKGKELLTLDEARQYLLWLINRERAGAGLPALVLDPVACVAAQEHAEDTARIGYNDHYDLQGRSPDWRYTLAGGRDVIGENQLGVYCDNNATYGMPKDQRFMKREIERVHALFFEETPPQDGHRRNILERKHNKVGLGLAVCWMEEPDGGNRTVTCCEEFVDCYGRFSIMPTTILCAHSISLAGLLAPGFRLYNVDVHRENLPTPRPLSDLRKNAYHGYQLPDQRVATYWPRDIQMLPDGGFQLVVPVDKKWKKGLYHFDVWITDGRNEPFVASRRIVAVSN